ncbi:MAG: hypothetical protein A2Z24_01925 [Candidatus Woykebacteria bacterium RBG_16_44_10]|uniref:Uncharacterized protein n=1 Tax=Candidatus Woykebacteria bacterium RBG_16_44_10 TaxID=1802597 RepID=A0A1G1WF95_9BACT|nr:MAG: hypothetical protein A2Z24_01925 [Candidatus Woykebacteria bacterium RBG_16_44_10]
MSPGLKTAIAYSLPSYQLGFCGPQEAKSRNILRDFAAGKKVDEEAVKEVFRHFEAPYPYFKLIAKSNRITDPFDKKVVKAMWVGNELLDNVKTEDLRNLIRAEFVKPNLLSQEEAEKRVAKIPDGAVPHHSFHVLILGPVAGRVDLKGSLLDLCRVGWGRVSEIKNRSLRNSKLSVSQYSRALRPPRGLKNLQVISKPLILGKRMRLGKEIEREVGWNKNILPKVKIGDWVSFHWGVACEILSPEEAQNLEHYTQKTIDLVNLK